MLRFARYLCLAAVALLAACGGQQQTTRNQTISGNAQPVDLGGGDTLNFQGVSLMFGDITAIGLADLHEFYPGLFSTDIAPVAPDGSFEVVLPTKDELPESLLVSSGSLFAYDGGTCSLSSSKTGVRTTMYTFDGPPFAVPMMTLYSPLFSVPTFTTAEPVNTDEDEMHDHVFLSWVFAEDAVSVDSLDTPCVVDTEEIHVDLDLKAGWNTVGLSLIYDAVTDTVTGANLNVVDVELVHLLPAAF